VPDQHRAEEHAPDQQAQAELQRLKRAAAEQQFGDKPGGEEQDPRRQDDAEPGSFSLNIDIEAVA
jgi:hypothetical protein